MVKNKLIEYDKPRRGDIIKLNPNYAIGIRTVEFQIVSNA